MAVLYARKRVDVAGSLGEPVAVIGRVAGGFAAVCVLLFSSLSHADDITYGYDAVGRLTLVTVSGNTAYYDYDAAGNITAIRRQGSVAAARADDASNATASRAAAR